MTQRSRLSAVGGRTRAFARSARGPATLFVIVLVLVVALTVLWNVVLSRDYLRIRELATRAAEEEGAAFHWTFLALGSSLFVAIIVLLAILGVELFGEIRLNQRQSLFIATVTHELNSPLASIKLYAQTLRNPALAEAERARFLETLLSDVERLRALIANVLRTAQIEAERLRLQTEAVSLRAWLEAYVAEVAPAVEKRSRGSELVLAPGDLDARVALDALIFRHVLDNLVDNALKYGRGERVRIEVALAPAPASPLRGGGPRVAIEVRDDGIGIPRTELRRIFERFARIEDDDPARSRQGTGLGLSIARSLIELHGGAISASSPGPGEGATIRIELPSLEDRAPADSPLEGGRTA
jgi:signal transduction histidine kinase